MFDECGVINGDGLSCSTVFNVDMNCMEFSVVSITGRWPGSCDCNGTLLGWSNENFDCAGNCLLDTDCAGTCGGDAVVDECGVCDGSGIADGA